MPQRGDGYRYLLVRIVVPGGVIFDPAINGIQFLGENPNAAVYMFQWAKRLSAGSHTVRAQVAVQDAASTFEIGS